MNNSDEKIDRDDDVWNQVTIIRGKIAAADKLRDGRMKEVEKRGGQLSNQAIAMAKLDNTDDVGKLKTNTKEFGKLVTAARIAKGYNSRKKFASRLQVNEKDLADIENGTGKYNGPLVGKCKRELKIGFNNKNK